MRGPGGPDVEDLIETAAHALHVDDALGAGPPAGASCGAPEAAIPGGSSGGAIRVLDGAVAVLGGAGGVKPQGETDSEDEDSEDSEGENSEDPNVDFEQHDGGFGLEVRYGQDDSELEVVDGQAHGPTAVDRGGWRRCHGHIHEAAVQERQEAVPGAHSEGTG